MSARIVFQIQGENRQVLTDVDEAVGFSCFTQKLRHTGVETNYYTEHDAIVM